MEQRVACFKAEGMVPVRERDNTGERTVRRWEGMGSRGQVERLEEDSSLVTSVSGLEGDGDRMAERRKRRESVMARLERMDSNVWLRRRKCESCDGGA